MSIALYRLARFAYGHPARVLAAWGLAVLAVVGMAVTQSPRISGGVSLSGTSSQVVLDTIASRLPIAAGAAGSVVFVAEDGGRIDTPERTAAIEAALQAALATGFVVDVDARTREGREQVSAQIRNAITQRIPAGVEVSQDVIDAKVTEQADGILARMTALTASTVTRGHHLEGATGPLGWVTVSDDGTAGVATLLLTGQVADLPNGSLSTLREAMAAPAARAGIRTAASSSLEPTSPPVGGEEAIGLIFAVLVLVLTLRSLIAAGLPVLNALLGVGIGVGSAFGLSAHYEMTSSTPALGLMLGLAVGIDYSLFIIHKARALLRNPATTPREAAARAVGTAGSAVFFAGLTVVIALLGLITLRLSFVTTMALTAAATVVLAVAIGLSALPALLGLLGERLRPRQRKAARAESNELTAAPAHRDLAASWARAVTRRPWLVILLVTAALAALAIPATGLRLGMPSGSVAAAGSTARVNYDAVTKISGEGSNAPLIVALRRPTGHAADFDLMDTWKRELLAVPGVADARLMGASDDRDLVAFSVLPSTGPTDPATEELVHRLRTASLTNADVPGVTGLTAINIDLSEALRRAIPIYLGIVVALSLVVLLLVFRSVLVPLAATGGFLLAIAATIGLVVLAFSTDGFTWLVGRDRPGPVLSFLPIMATGVLYGLAMDYQVFLASSIREEHVHGASAHDAVVEGFSHASRVVLAAATIMVSVFAGFVLSEDTMIRQFGFALSIGILIDAFLIRMTVMPAVLHLAGEGAWWLPRWLDRLLPSVDVEGEALTRLLGDHRSPGAPAQEHTPAHAASRG